MLGNKSLLPHKKNKVVLQWLSNLITFHLVSIFSCPIPRFYKVKHRLSQPRYIWNNVIQVDCQYEPEKECSHQPLINTILSSKILVWISEKKKRVISKEEELSSELLAVVWPWDPFWFTYNCYRTVFILWCTLCSSTPANPNILWSARCFSKQI